MSVSRAGRRGDRDSWGPAISVEGRFVAFSSFASNLAAGDTNHTFDVFLRDREASKTTRISVSRSGEQANGNSERAAVSARGRFVAFSSDASNLVTGDMNTCTDEDGNRSCHDVFVRDRAAETTTRMSVSSREAEANDDSDGAAISADGRSVTFTSLASNLVPDDTNNARDVFVRDRVAGTTTLVSVGR